MDSFYIWIIVAVVCLVIELSAGNFVMICFCLGALTAFLTSVFGFSVVPQIIMFALSSAASIFFLRPLAVRYFHGKKERKSNADAMLGRTGKVVEAVEENGFGRIALDGDVWKAQTVDGSAVPQGMPVKIIDRKSTILIVEQINQEKLWIQ